MKISFVIPAYNEEESIKILYGEILENIQSYDYEIIFLDDGSTDKTFSEMKKIANEDKNVRLVRFRRNFGKSDALNYGFKIVQGDIVFTMDADLQDNPSEIPKFIEKIQEGYDLVSGWKKNRKDPISKRLPSKIYNFVTSRSFGLKLKDMNCGFKAYRKNVVKEIDVYGEMHRYIPALAHSIGFKVGEVVVHHRKRSFGSSKFGAERLLRGMFDLFKVKMITRYGKSPLYFFGKYGLLLSSIGTGLGFYLTILKIFFNQSLSNRPLLFLAILLIISGLQLFSIGLISELVVNKNRKIDDNKISIREKINIDDD